MTEAEGSPTSASTMKSVFKPSMPKFGRIAKVGTDHWAAWTGGKPKGNWSSLEKNPESITPTQY